MYTYKVISKPTGRSYLQKKNKTSASLPHKTSKQPDAPQSRRGKAHRAPDVNRIAEHVEREAFNAGVHQDPEIVAQEPARDAERPCRGQDEGLPDDEERDGDEGVERGGEEARMRLF